VTLRRWPTRWGGCSAIVALAHRLTAAGRVLAAGQSWGAIAAVHAEVYARALAAHRGGDSWTAAAKPSRVKPSTAVEGDAGVIA